MTAGVQLPGPDPRHGTDRMRSHLRRQQIEDVRFLLGTGLLLDGALARVGVSHDAWQKWTEKGLTGRYDHEHSSQPADERTSP